MKRFSVLMAALTVAVQWFACAGDDAGDVSSTSSTGPWSACHTQPGDPCTSDQDCCIGERGCPSVCVHGACQIDIEKDFKSQIRGDCIRLTCDEQGFTESVPAPEDIPVPYAPCDREYCNDKSRVTAFVAKGPSPDGSGFCTGRSDIPVQCLATADCKDAALICSANGKCVPPSCNDRSFEPALGETAIDCGGPCDLCQVGQACKAASDCPFGVCSPEGLCALATCDDGVKNLYERDVDCGGDCPNPCDDGKGCVADKDCKSFSCYGGKCQPATCDDFRRNGGETGRDCGGDCPPCE